VGRASGRIGRSSVGGRRNGLLVLLRVVPFAPQRAVWVAHRLQNVEGRHFVWIRRRCMHRTTLDENTHENDEGHAHQQDGPPVLRYPLSYGKKCFAIE